MSFHFFILAMVLSCVLLAPAQAGTHIVQGGETLTSIATKYGVDLRTLARANNLQNRDTLRQGQKLHIPVATTVFVEHRVTRGDTLATIGQHYRCTVADLRAHNILTNPNHIVIGQVLKVPVVGPRPLGGSKPLPKPAPRRTLPPHVQDAIDGTPVRVGAWRNIVIHHSATNEGSGKGMDRYHREERQMENGLAYHFAIGNGHGMRDGEIYIGARWTKQLPGGHLAIEALNQVSIGICLVGDFEERPPTERQLESLEALVRALQMKTSPKPAEVTSHRRIHPKHTKCPGRYFPFDAFLERLRRS